MPPRLCWRWVVTAHGHPETTVLAFNEIGARSEARKALKLGALPRFTLIRRDALFCVPALEVEAN